MVEWIGLLSLTMIGLGSFMIYEPLGLLIPGMILFFMCAQAARRATPKKGN